MPESFTMNFESGIEAVLSLVETGLPPETKKVATGFGGGIGLFGDTCGALAIELALQGACALLSRDYHRRGRNRRGTHFLRPG